MLKKTTAVLTSIGAWAVTFPALAASHNADHSVTKFGLDYGTVLGLGSRDLRTTALDIVNILLGFLGVIAIIVILYGGFMWMTAGGNEDKVGEAKKMITAGIVGIIIVLAAFAIATFVINQVGEATGATGF
tara:strand:+ start:572 stop:964 length:393 start_codon:yes stop_codon:yes gene_type:complete